MKFPQWPLCLYMKLLALGTVRQQADGIRSQSHLEGKR